MENLQKDQPQPITDPESHEVPPTKKPPPILYILIGLFGVLTLIAFSYVYYSTNQEEKESLTPTQTGQNINEESEITELEKELSDKDKLIDELRQEQASQEQLLRDLESNISTTEEQLDDMEDPDYFTNYMPTRFLFGQPQKVGQTFLQDITQTISGVEFRGSYGVGGDIALKIYELNDPKTIELTNLVAQGTFPATDIFKQELFEIPLDSSVDLIGGKHYFILVETLDEKTEAGIAFAEANILKDGRLYLFTRLIGGNGNILDHEHQWQPRNNYDMLFTLK